ncbi:MAG: VanZ family protein, partial [Flavisolibacter sp.]
MKDNRLRYFFLFLLVSYFLILLRVIVFKGSAEFIIGHIRNFPSLHKGWTLANFIPFKTIYYYVSLQEVAENGLENVGGNIVLFIPYGLLLPLAIRCTREFRKLLLTVFITSLCFESIQLLFDLGSFDVDDLLLNTIGGTIGYLFFLFYSSLLSDALAEKEKSI